jgi:hypothetical protein
MGSKMCDQQLLIFKSILIILTMLTINGEGCQLATRTVSVAVLSEGQQYRIL